MTTREALDLAWHHFKEARYHDAMNLCRQVLSVQPQNAAAIYILALSLENLGEVGLAAEHLSHAIALDPRNREMRNDLGKMLAALWRVKEAIAWYRSALEVSPDYTRAHSALVYWLMFDPESDAQAVLRERLHWTAVQARGIQPATIHPNDRDPRRKLRIGYLSAYFRSHAVNAFVEPIIRSHDRENFEVYCYSDVQRGDAATIRLVDAAAQWRATFGQSNDAVVETIKADGIDILVDLTGHMGINRMLLFAHKPAPVQVSYIGDQATSGLATMDWRITDAIADPPGAEAHYVERLYRLPRAFFVYQPWAEAPPVSPGPMQSRGYVTFGSFNNTAKLSPGTIRTWAELLAAVPQSRLMILVDDVRAVGERLRPVFRDARINDSRVEFVARKPTPSEYLKLFQHVDIALDPFPFSGHTTTCDALWMGAATVTLRGESYAGRMSASVMQNVGLGDLIASTPSQYISIAASLATSPQRLAELRITARQRMTPITDAPRFTRELEAAYRGMRRDYCARPSTT